MRKVIDCLLSKFGVNNNREVNVLVSRWYAARYNLFDMQVSLKDINEMAVVRTLEHAIDTYKLSFDDMGGLALLPALAANKCDIFLRIVYLPSLIESKLSSFCSVEYGYWSDKDEVTISDAGEHIKVVKNEGGHEYLGVYLNGTVNESGEKFSVSYTKDEINRLFDDVGTKLLNGVQLEEQALQENIVLRALFYRLIDSDIGFMLSQQDEALYEMTKKMVSVGTEAVEQVEQNTFVFSSWGERIGVAFKKYDITDIKRAQTETPHTVKHLSVVVDNSGTDGMTAVTDVKNEEVCQEWGTW